MFLITIMISVLVGFSLNVATIIVGSAKITGNVANSIKAFHCADSGIEYALYQVKNLPGSGFVCDIGGTSFPASPGYVDSDSNYTFTGIASSTGGDCGTGTEIDVSGTFGETTRKLHIDY